MKWNYFISAETGNFMAPLAPPLPCRHVQGDEPDTVFNVATYGFPLDGESSDHDVPATVAVLLHGAGHCAQSWSAFVSRLEGTVRVIAPDQRGHGASHAADEDDLRNRPLILFRASRQDTG